MFLLQLPLKIKGSIVVAIQLFNYKYCQGQLNNEANTLECLDADIA